MWTVDLIIVLRVVLSLVCLFLVIHFAKKTRKWRIQCRIRVLQRSFPDSTFAIVNSRPFVFVSDEVKADLATLIDHTVNWIVPKLKSTCFGKIPKANATIWLLRNRESYENYVHAYGTPELLLRGGYFSSRNNEIVMDSCRCYGPLLHEMVHAFVDADFRDCPAWFNEGLATLYGTCNEEGEVLNHSHARLSDIQSAIFANTVLSLDDLCALTWNDFSGNDAHKYYAQTEYLCYYLQQKGLLKEFYRECKRNHWKDPTGYATLQKVVKCKDVQDFQKDWEEFILGISSFDETPW